MQFPAPSLTPSPSTHLSGVKRKEPTSICELLLPQQPQPLHGSLTYKAQTDNLHRQVMKTTMPSSNPFSSLHISKINKKESTSSAQHQPPQQPQPFHGSFTYKAQTDNLHHQGMPFPRPSSCSSPRPHPSRIKQKEATCSSDRLPPHQPRKFHGSLNYEAQTDNLHHQEMPFPRPSSCPSPRPRLSEIKQKETTSSSDRLPPQQPLQFHGSLTYKGQTDNLHRQATPFPRPSPSLSPHLSEIKQKEPTSSHDHQPSQQPQKINGNLIYKSQADNLCCKVCQVYCSGPFNFKQHLRGHKHKAKLQELEFRKKNGGEVAVTQRKWCELCKVSCMNESLLEMHLQGQKHKAKVQELEVSKRSGGCNPKQRKWCDLCKIWCIDNFSFEQHLDGKKHFLRLHSVEIEKETMKEKSTMAKVSWKEPVWEMIVPK
ncbi:Zinc finger RNA-binding protein [Quillaja saponaria]|nr:Zinc finger RNA-binding protein [Quillaja saponaria]